MINKHKLLAMAALAIGLLLPGQLLAAWTAVTRADLNLRVGPDTIYGVIDVIPAGEPVEVIGCVDHFEWCDVEWLGLRGFVSAQYLVQPGTSVYLPQYAPSIGVPIISFSFGTYHDRYYRDRSWHRKRHWGGRWRERRRHRVEEPRRKKWVEERRRKTWRAEEPRRKYRVEEPRRKKWRAEEPRRKYRVEEQRRRVRIEQPVRRPVAEQRRQHRAEDERTRRQRAIRRSQHDRRPASTVPEPDVSGR